MNVLRKSRKSKFNFSNNRVFLIVLLFVMTTFAWFTYIKTLDTNVNLRINTWNVKYYEGDGESKTEISVRPYTTSYSGDLYPGMLTLVRKITVENNGEVYIKTSCEFASLKILGHDYEIFESSDDVPETYSTDGETHYYVIKGEAVESGDYKEQDFITVTNSIPFKLSILLPTQIKNGESDTVTISLSWEGEFVWTEEDDDDEDVNAPFTYDGEKDELDTKWGNDIANFKANNEENESLISIGLNINAYQVVTDDVIVNKTYIDVK